VFAPSPPAVRSASMGATIYELEYRISDRRSRKTLASASEFVFDWGRFSILRTLVAGGSTASVEACGYALPQPHMFRSNVYRDPTWEAYSKADKELIVSVLPSGRVSTSGKWIRARI
jgi:hypothetical protein